MSVTKPANSLASKTKEKGRVRKQRHRRDSERRHSLTGLNMQESDTSGWTERGRAKRKRNRTIDNHDLWCGTVAVVTQKTYFAKDGEKKAFSLREGQHISKEETACQV